MFEARIVLKMPNLKLFFWNLTCLEWPFLAFFAGTMCGINWRRFWSGFLTYLVSARPRRDEVAGLRRKKSAFSAASVLFLVEAPCRFLASFLSPNWQWKIVGKKTSEKGAFSRLLFCCR